MKPKDQSTSWEDRLTKLDFNGPNIETSTLAYNIWEKEWTEILEAVFLHGKETPDKSHDLPEGQLTIAEALLKFKDLLASSQRELLEKLGDGLRKYHEKYPDADYYDLAGYIAGFKSQLSGEEKSK